MIITAAVILTKPVMHKPAVLEDAAFTLASLEKKTPVKEVKTDFPSSLPPAQKTVVQKPAPVVKRIVRIVRQEVPAPVQTVTVKQQPVQQKTQPVKTVTPEKTEVKLPVKTLEAANETVLRVRDAINNALTDAAKDGVTAINDETLANYLSTANILSTNPVVTIAFTGNAAVGGDTAQGGKLTLTAQGADTVEITIPVGFTVSGSNLVLNGGEEASA